MALSPFIWEGNTGTKLTPDQVRQGRQTADALRAQRRGTPTNAWEGINAITGALTERMWRDEADQAEKEGRERAGGLFADLAINQDPNAIIAALTSPDAQWASDAQTSIASSLLNQGLERADPAYQTDLALKRAQLEAAQNPQPDYPTSVDEYLYAQQDPGFAAWQAQNGGGQTINVGGEGVKMGTVPPGYAAVEDPTNPSGYRLEVIPNGPADIEQQAAAAKADASGGRKDLATEIITGAADKARSALTSGGITTGTAGAVVGLLPESQAAELRRQVDVLKANATIENLTAMRQASPTGGALGSVTEKEGAMLAAASGAIDPNASYDQVVSAIDNYERTLLQVVHGPVEGEKIYQETRADNDAGWVDMGNGVRVKELSN